MRSTPDEIHHGSLEAVELVLFDLGGVLADFGGAEPLKRLSGLSDTELWRRWLTCEWVRRFESGRCSPEDFARGFVTEWEIPGTAEAFLAEIRGWEPVPLPGAEELVSEVGSSVRVGCLSNTNLLHWEGGMATWPLIGLFDHRFFSFELGLLKPDSEIFEEVSRRLGTAPNRILFLDDNAINVEGARAVGFNGEVVNGVQEARSALIRQGLITADPALRSLESPLSQIARGSG